MTNIISALASAAALAQTGPDGGLTFGEVLGAIPTDPASIFTVLLLVGSVGLVLWFGRPKGGKGGKPAREPSRS
ncbi:MAG TPA: hypothetical protein VMM35_08755, partial [Longimicrobiales bacterium]|nr:hypothetical protein [Longimicrobiales bacterium]